MLHVQVQKEKRSLSGYLLSLLLFLAVLFFFLFGVRARESKSEEESLASLRNAIQRACVQCYAIEGRYPPSVEYLEEHYGIVIDRDRYHVFYDGWASNVMPDITVLPAEPDSQEKEGTS